MSKVELIIELDEPPGYELTGEFRPAVMDEPYLTNGKVETARYTTLREYPILRKKWVAPECFPNGSWVYRSPRGWEIANVEPCKLSGGSAPYGYGGAPINVTRCFGKASDLADLFGQSFTPPHVDCIQVVR